MSDQVLLDIQNLSVGYLTRRGMAQAVQNVNLQIKKNEIVGIVGESGCGKSTLANAVMRLLPDGAYITEGSIKLEDTDIVSLSGETLRKFRWQEIAMVFQGAMNVLNPVKTVGSQFQHLLMAHNNAMTKAQALDRAKELLRLVRIDENRLNGYAHELSGGMRQRIVIAMAIALNPKLVILDEPTTALDVIVQRSILAQIVKLKEEFGFSIMFISHDFNLVAEISNRVAVMYAGRMIELGSSTGKWGEHVHHPYTKGLIRAVPQLRATDTDEVIGIPGSLPSLLSLPDGCKFHPRCSFAKDICKLQSPPIQVIDEIQMECHLSPEELRDLNHARG